MHKPKTTKVHDADNKPFCIIGSVKLYVHGGRMTELVNILVSGRLAVPATLVCDLCDQLAELVSPKKRTIELVDASTVPIVRRYGKQQSTVTENAKILSFRKRKAGVSLKVTSTQHVRIPSFRQTGFTVRLEREGLILVPRRMFTGKLIECSAAC